MQRKFTFKKFAPIVIAVMAVVMAACASIGRPQGGPRDYTPPRFVRSTPSPGQTNANPRRMELYFDENVELDDAFNKVVVSPATGSTPVVRALGHRVTVEFRDTLLANTTYTIDFGDAIKDLNEGNIIDGFAVDFATGPTIDTLRISGMVFEARTLEPAQGMTVAVTDNLSDTALTHVPFERIARTNQYGQFTVRNLKPGTYRIYAIDDVNRDRLWDRSENIAFYETTVTPSAESIVVTDTLRSSEGTDSLSTRPATHFTPDDVVLMWFNEDFKPQYVKDHSRPDRRRIVINMGAPADSLPHVTIADGDMAGTTADNFALTAANPTCDSLTYWITDPRVLASDTLRLAIAYQGVDSLQMPALKTDTIPFVFRAPKEKKKDKNKDKQLTDSVPPIQPLAIQLLSTATQELRRPLGFRLTEPIASLDTAALRLETLVDTIWQPLPLPPVRAVASAPLTDRTIDFDWQPGAKYRLSIDSAAIRSVYDTPSAPFSTEITAKKLEDYANLTFNITPEDSTAIVVELLDSSDKVVRASRLDPSTGKALFELVAPGTYYARVFFDRNGDGLWTTGNVAQGLQPEESAYYPKRIDLRANWDNELTWQPYQLPLDQQKPYDIKKNRPKLKAGEERPDGSDEELDEWGNPINGQHRGQGNNFSLPGGFGSGGRQQSSGNSATIRDNRRR